MASLQVAIKSVIVAIVNALWSVLLRAGLYAFTPFLMVWFLILGPLVTTSSLVVLAILAAIYWACLSTPLMIYRHYGNHALQWTSETYAVRLRSMGLGRLTDSIQQLVYAGLNSRTADAVVIASRSAFLLIRGSVMRGGHRVLELIATFMFLVPHVVWLAIFAVLGSLFMLGGGATVYIVYYQLWGAADQTIGKDYRNVQRQKFEANMGAYQPLRHGHVRLLHLLPGRFGDPLCCRLEVAELATARYEALSYVWGNPTMDRQIQAGEKPLWITRNLYDALNYLRRETETRILWVDAVCINQIDYDERQRQVSQMRDIYHCASCVIIWLGIAPFGLRQAFETARKGIFPTIYHYGTARVVAQLLRAPWWMRVWVVQELVMARNVVVKCSDHELDWENFCRMADIAIASPSFPLEGTYAGEYQALENQRRSISVAKSKDNLLQLLCAFRKKQATNERDKIFAFLGLSNVVDIEGDEQAIIRPDYEAKPDDIFRACGIKSINASRSLAVTALSECVQISYLAQQPRENLTWCPCWSRTGNDFVATPLWLGDMKEAYSPPPWSKLRFSAAGGLPAPKCEVSKNIVRFEGWEADEIVEVGRKTSISRLDLIDKLTEGLNMSDIHTSFLVQQDWLIVLGMWEALARTHSGTRSNEMSVEKAFYATITAGVYCDGKPSDTRDEEYMRAVHAACYHRTFFVTATGRLGLGPNHTAVGNKVFILLGSDVPMVLGASKKDLYGSDNEFVITKSGGASSVYANIGQAYVDDLMTYRGDLMKDLDEGHSTADYVYIY